MDKDKCKFNNQFIIKRSNDNTYKVEKMGYMKDHTCLGSDNK